MRGSFAGFVGFLGCLANSFHGALAALAHILDHFLATVAKLFGKFICPGAGIGSGGFGAGNCFFRSHLCLVTQLNGFILDQCAGLFTRLRSEQQCNNGSRKPANNEAYKKGAKLITIRHSNLLLVIKQF